MNADQFTLLEILDTLNNASTVDELALRYGLTVRTIERRLRLAIRAGNITSTTRNGRVVYTPSREGRSRYRNEMARLAGEPMRPVPELFTPIRNAFNASTLIQDPAA